MTPLRHDGPMTALADAVLPHIRTRSDIHRWSASNAHGAQMHAGVDLLEEALETSDPTDVLDVTQRSIASALKVIMRADDSSGIIGDACRRLLDLHPIAADRARVQPAKLVRWMIHFQFHEECDFFTLDPVAYAPTLGDDGMRSYRSELERIRADLGPQPSRELRWGTSNGHAWFVLEETERRLAVHDHDVAAIIRTHARDQRVPAWLVDTSDALAEIGQIDAAIEWAKRAADHPRVSHQAIEGGERWCELLAEHRPDELLQARLTVFRRWPDATHAARLHRAAGEAWPQMRREVMSALAADPREAVNFALTTLEDPTLAWRLAHDLVPSDDETWLRVAGAYEAVDPLATLSIYSMIAANTLVAADARAYRHGARTLARVRDLAAGTEREGEVADLITELRETHRRRPRLQKEFDRAGLP